jgi:cell filamentation protein
VLRNLLGITDAAELARAEAALSASRLIDLERRRLPGRYDLAHLQAFHRYILGDVYDWAGQLRTVSIAKGSVFCLPQHMESYAADVFGRLAAADPLRGLARDAFTAVNIDPRSPEHLYRQLAARCGSRFSAARSALSCPRSPR